MNLIRLILRNWRLLLSAFVAAVVIHLWTTLAAVTNQTTPAFARLAAKLPVNQISYLPEVTPQNQMLPFMLPDVRYAMCRYDASDGAIRIQAVIPGPGWSLSLHAPNGDNFLYVPGTADRATRINLVVKSSRNFVDGKGIEAAAPTTAAGRPEIKVENPVGVAIYRAPVDAIALRRMVDEQLNSFRCRAAPRS